MRWAPQSFAVAMCGRAHTSGSSPWRMSRRRTRLHSHLPVPHAGAATCKRCASARTPRRVFDRETPPCRVQSGNRGGGPCRRRCLRAPTRTSSLWLQHRSASVDCAVSCPPFSNQALTFFFSDTNQAIIFKQRYAAEIENFEVASPPPRSATTMAYQPSPLLGLHRPILIWRHTRRRDSPRQGFLRT